MQFREIIHTHRERAGWTKKKLAELVGVTQPYIVQIENDGKIPSDSVVTRLADCLGLDRRELLYAAYRARAPKDLKEYFATFLEDLVPTGGFDQPFIQSRRSYLESPDFIVKTLGASVGGGYQISLLATKHPDAHLPQHTHSTPVTLVAIEGTFELQTSEKTERLDPHGRVSATVQADVPHSLRARGMGKVITIGNGARRPMVRRPIDPQGHVAH
jgi:transcriptional regulator with XRE-family HTH domain